MKFKVSIMIVLVVGIVGIVTMVKKPKVTVRHETPASEYIDSAELEKLYSGSNKQDSPCPH